MAEVLVVVPDKPSADGAALDDRWTRHCLEMASRRVFWWVLLGALAFTGQLVLIFWFEVSSQLPLVLLLFSVLVVGWGLVRRQKLPRALGDEPWRLVRVHWRNGRLVVHGERPVVLEVRGAGPLVRGRITRLRRAWLVVPDREGNTVVTFAGVPRLFPARVLRATPRRSKRRRPTGFR